MKLYLTAAIAALTATSASAQQVASLPALGGVSAGAVVAGLAALLIIGAVISDDDDSSSTTR